MDMLGWIDFSGDERNKVLGVIHSLDEPQAVDELGIGPIRDGFSDCFFPGTSTVQTRAKYFFIVPYILMEAVSVKENSGVRKTLDWIDEKERRCRDILLKRSPDTEGVIGSRDTNGWVKRTPANIYWNGIKRLGLFTEDLTIREYVAQSLLLKEQRKARNEERDSRDREQQEPDDRDAGDLASVRFWNLENLYHKGWRESLTIDLLPQEADVLKTKIITAQRDSLFAFLLEHDIDPDGYDNFAALREGIGDRADEHLKSMMKLACDFNDLLSILTTRYNLIVSDGKNARAEENWTRYKGNLQHLSSVDLAAVFSSLHIRRSDLKTFLRQVQSAVRAGDIETVDQLIRKRECAIKTPKRAKTNRVGEFSELDWIGIDRLDYRFAAARRIIRDIRNAEAAHAKTGQ